MSTIDPATWPFDDKRVFYFEDYGAVGDGVADDTDAIEACMNACLESGGGIVTSRHGGTYVISKTIEPKKDAES